MRKTELVDVEDVYPYEQDEQRMNPRDVSSPETQAYIDDLAKQFLHNRLDPGQPRMRPILYQEGGIYWIIDGECRWLAMRKLGTKRFWADVYDDLSDAELARQEAAKAMVETNTKRPLTQEELSRGVQMMLDMDVPDEDVAASARIDEGKVRDVRRASKVVKDAAYDMTLDRLAAIADFEGDDEAVAKLRDCKPSEWESIYRELCSNRKWESRCSAIVSAAVGTGAVERDVVPDGYKPVRFVSPAEPNADETAKDVVSGSKDPVVVRSAYSVLICSRMDPDEAKQAEEEEEDERERREFAQRAGVLCNDMKSDVEAWIGSHGNDIRTMPKTAEFLAKKVESSLLADRWEDLSGAKLHIQPSTVAVAYSYLYTSASWMPNGWVLSNTSAYTDSLSNLMELIGAMEEDGFEPSKATLEVKRIVKEAIDGDQEG